MEEIFHINFKNNRPTVNFKVMTLDFLVLLHDFHQISQVSSNKRSLVALITF